MHCDILDILVDGLAAYPLQIVDRVGSLVLSLLRALLLMKSGELIVLGVTTRISYIILYHKNEIKHAL